MSDRYPSAAELADDLRAFLAPAFKRGREDAVSREIPLAPAPVVPKGLRCFDQMDREFFLRLVPGPRDRRGVPEAVRFWGNLLQERDANNTFRVGLLYGPSGCGKSSLIRAGVVPQLGASVRVLVIEAAHDETERRLTAEIHRYFPGLPSGQSLAELLADIREGSALPPGEKLVIVIDQFEQWLHGWRQDERAARRRIAAVRRRPCTGTCLASR